VESPPVYLYGVVDAVSALPELRERRIEESAEPPRLVELGAVSALVSSLSSPDVAPSAANLKAHVGLLAEVAAATAVLPASFGLVAPNAAALESSLGPRADELAGLLREIGDHVELSVTAAYAGDTALREAVAAEPAIVRLHEKLAGVPAEAAYYDRIRLGELVAEALQRRRAHEAGELVTQMSALASDVRTTEVGDPLLLRAAFLVRRDAIHHFEERLEREAAARSGRVRVTLAGPLAPHSFVSVPLTAEPVA
jgi:hypothetical protein